MNISFENAQFKTSSYKNFLHLYAQACGNEKLSPMYVKIFIKYILNHREKKIFARKRKKGKERFSQWIGARIREIEKEGERDRDSESEKERERYERERE